MTDKVQKIREEIEKRYECWREKEFNSHSIESEIRMSECQHLLLMLNSSQEEPVSEDLEEAAEEWDESLYRSDAFKAGAKWQKEKDESTTEDLGKYINELSKQFPEVSFAKLSRIAVRVAKWQKEQMMKDVVDGEIFCAVAYPHQPKAVSKPISGGYKFGDKVKLLIIKED